jgi:hypothetical protein
MLLEAIILHAERVVGDRQIGGPMSVLSSRVEVVFSN